LRVFPRKAVRYSLASLELEFLFEPEPKEIEFEPPRGELTPDEQIAADFDSLTGVRAVEATLAPTEFDDA